MELAFLQVLLAPEVVAPCPGAGWHLLAQLIVAADQVHLWVAPDACPLHVALALLLAFLRDVLVVVGVALAASGDALAAFEARRMECYSAKVT